MQIVIDIPEWKYKSIYEGVEASKRCGVVGAHSYIYEAIHNGIVLPKGHGDIVDIETLKDMFWDGNFMEITKDDLSVIEPIIEADKESEEE